MSDEIDKEINQKLSIELKKLDSEELLLKKTLTKIENISKEIDLSDLVSENEMILITSKIEDIKTVLRTSYEYLTNKFEIETEKDEA